MIVTKEFHAALECYHHEVNVDCWLCSTDSPSTKEKPKSLDSTNSSLPGSLLQSHSLVCSYATKRNLESSDLTSQLTNSHTRSFPSLHPSSIAYLLHTTGTTGWPKPVRAPHCCVVPNVVDLRGRFAMSPDDMVFNAAPLTFDPSVVEVNLSNVATRTIISNTSYMYVLSTVDISCTVIWSLSAHSAPQSQAISPLPLSSAISAAVCDCAAGHPSACETATRECDHKSTPGARFTCQSTSIWRGSMSLFGNSCTVEITHGTHIML